ncbi:MAG: c-type cytochrome [Humidesulfovibrio sp.]|uniref:c-type cytochrome n=1 Tax=Humidesulfovibrio sp. TaxID=2910988 RepID=UPI0027344D74|nr:c-type cytochrome [Humidesulfovibrio sp.]MDP2847711.1 c-type cytochrome [Humidesulfovibrio sp.]
MSATADPKAFYAAKCAGCHATDGSKGLKGKAAEYVEKALNGYKAKSFGGAKKEIMEARAALLSDADIRALAKLVASF